MHRNFVFKGSTFYFNTTKWKLNAGQLEVKMCILLCAIGLSDKYPFILASNRDEFFIRKTSQLSLNKGIISPRDLARPNGGTWIGCDTQSGKFCCLVNFRESLAQVVSPVSRGRLPAIYLEQDEELLTKFCDENREEIGGFSFVYGGIEDDTVHVISNRGANKEFGKNSIFGLSNSSIDNSWPKVKLGESLLRDLVARSDQLSLDELIDQLFQLMSTNSMEFPSMSSLESSIFIPPIETPKHDNTFFGNYYGTRTQTLIVGLPNGKVVYLERTLHSEDAPVRNENSILRFDFNLSKGKLS